MTDIAMTIARRGAQAALRRVYALRGEQQNGIAPVGCPDDDGGPMGTQYAESLLTVGGG